MFIADRAEAEADEILVDVAYTGLLALVLRGYSFRPSPPVVPRYPFCFFFLRGSSLKLKNRRYVSLMIRKLFLVNGLNN